MRTRVVVVIDIAHGTGYTPGRVAHVVESYFEHGTFREGLEASLDGSDIGYSEIETRVIV